MNPQTSTPARRGRGAGETYAWEAP